LVEVKHQRAMSKIDDAQDVQKQVQDSRVGSRLRREALAPGTQVMIKRDGIIPKLSSRFSGPFIVLRRTANFNYELQDILGNVVLTPYPLHKLKICDQFDSDIQEFDEIEEVLNHKKENDNTIYLVKWKNDPTPSWVSEEHFYFAKLNNAPVRPKRTWKKKANKVNFCLSVLI
jgi:hypothetical protein